MGKKCRCNKCKSRCVSYENKNVVAPSPQSSDYKAYVGSTDLYESRNVTGICVPCEYKCLMAPGPNNPVMNPGPNNPVMNPGPNNPVMNPGQKYPVMNPGPNNPVMNPGQKYTVMNPGPNNPVMNPGQKYPFITPSPRVAALGGGVGSGYGAYAISTDFRLQPGIDPNVEKFFPCDQSNYTENSAWSSNSWEPVPRWNISWEYPGWTFFSAGYYNYKIIINSKNKIAWIGRVYTKNGNQTPSNDNRYYDAFGRVTGQVRENQADTQIDLEQQIYVTGSSDVIYAYFYNANPNAKVPLLDIKSSTQFSIKYN